MSNLPFVSVVMPAYNAERFVASAVQSILGQSFHDFEFIIIDDGSTDGTVPILDSLALKDSRIRLVRQSNRGLIASLNLGCSMAQGVYVARMDADDISMPQRLEKQVKLLENRQDIGIVGTWIQDVDEAGTPGPQWPVPSNPSVIRWFLMFGNCLAHPTIMMRRDLVKNLGLYRPDAVHVEDYDLWIRASATTAIANIPEVLLSYRVYHSSMEAILASAQNAEIQTVNAAKLKTDAIAQATGRSVSVCAIRKLDRLIEAHSAAPADIDDAEQLLRDLYFAYVSRTWLSRAERSEIALDLIRRTWSMAAAARKISLGKSARIYFRSLRVVPDALSLHGIHTAAVLAWWFARESARTQRSIRSWKRLRI